MMRWSERETLQFARMYLKHEGLWNTEHPQYRVKFAREQAYTDIIKEFQAQTGIVLQNEEVRRKIKNLRSTYSQEVTKILRRSGPDMVYKPTIKWFADWHRCFKDSTRCRLKDDADDTSEPDDKTDKLLSESETHDDNTIQSDPFVSPDNESEDYIYNIKPEPEESSPKDDFRPRESKHKIKRKKFRQKTNLIFPERTGRGSLDSNSETKTKEDEFDIYGKFIASQLRKMELESALRMQLKIHSLMSEARITDMSNI